MDQHTPKSSEHHSESEDALEVPDMAVEVGGETLLLSASECRAEVLYASLLSGLSVLELLALTAGPVESAKMADGVIHVRFLDGAPIDAGAQLHEVTLDRYLWGCLVYENTVEWHRNRERFRKLSKCA